MNTHGKPEELATLVVTVENVAYYQQTHKYTSLQGFNSKWISVSYLCKILEWIPSDIMER